MAKKKSINRYEDLTVKQQRFVDYYDGNGTQAAEKAGYSCPRQAASRLLSNVNIQAALKTREKRRRKNHIASREERQAFWTECLRGNETQPAIVGTNSDGDSIVIDIPPKMTDRLKASELLGRSETDFSDKLGIGGIGPEGEIKEIPIVFVSPPAREEEEPPEPLPLPFVARLPLPAGHE